MASLKNQSAEIAAGSLKVAKNSHRSRRRRGRGMLRNVKVGPVAAAIRAGYSAKTADVAGPRLLSNVHIENAIQASRAAGADFGKLQRADAVRSAHGLINNQWNQSDRLRTTDLQSVTHKQKIDINQSHNLKIRLRVTFKGNGR